MNSPRLIIIAATFHLPLTDEMIASAADEIKQQEAKLVATINTPGSFEIPLIAQQVLEKKQADAIVALGYIEKGETLHGEIIGHSVYQALIDLQLKYHSPIGLGIIGPGATKAQAQARQETAARAAVKAVIHTLKLLNR